MTMGDAIMKTDVVIPFVEGPGDSIELRMALRSIERNVAGNVVVWLIGQAPGWVQNVRHVVMKRETRPRYQKFFDLNRKIHWVSSNEEIEQRFIYTYDDVYFLNPVGLEYLRQPRAGYDTSGNDAWMTKNDADVRWKECMRQTLDALKRENLPLYNYETHMPRVYNKEKALALLEKYDYRNFAFQFATMYFNNYCTDPVILKNEGDFKLAALRNVEITILKRKAKEMKVLNANIYRKDVIAMLKRMWPEKSRFER